MTKLMNIAVPKSEKALAVDVSALPSNVVDRLIEIGLTAHIRSSVNSAFSTEADKAVAANFAEQKTAFDAAEKAKAAKDAKYKVKTYTPPVKEAKAFLESFKAETDANEVAETKLAEMLEGKIRAARGTSSGNKVLMGLIKNNIVAVLMSKGKKQREATAMIGDDPMQFIEKTARKRAGDDEGVYKTELAKLHAQYVDPAKAMLSPEEAEEGEDNDDSADTDANDLI